MSVNKPGLPKLNLQSNTQASFKSALSSKLATTQRSSVSYGIFAQRSDRSKIYNPKAYLSNSTSATRHALLDNRVKVFNNNVASSCNHTSKTDNSNKYADVNITKISFYYSYLIIYILLRMISSK